MAKEIKCICKGNWRKIINESDPFFDKKYLNRDGEECVFVGVLWGSDDFYYTMWNLKTSQCSLLSCVGSIEGHGYKLKDEEKQNEENN
jgi:hypothetical protein